jgi:hypothetical protein
MLVDSEKDLMSLQDNYERARSLYGFLHKEMLKHGFSVKEFLLPEILNRNIVSSKFILDTVQEIFKSDIKKHSRKREVIACRHAGAYLLNRYTKLSFREIALLCGQNDHTSAMNSKKKCINWMNQDFEYRHNVEAADAIILMKIQSDQN